MSHRKEISAVRIVANIDGQILIALGFLLEWCILTDAPRVQEARNYEFGKILLIVSLLFYWLLKAILAWVLWVFITQLPANTRCKPVKHPRSQCLSQSPLQLPALSFVPRCWLMGHLKPCIPPGQVSERTPGKPLRGYSSGEHGTGSLGFLKLRLCPVLL